MSGRHMFFSRVVTGLLLSLAPALAFAAAPNFDRAASPGDDAGVVAGLHRLRTDPTLRRLGTVAHVDERHGVPNFVWALPARDAGAPAAAASPAGRSHESAARAALETLAPLYGLDRRDVREAPLRYVHDTGRGGIVVTFTQRVGGIDVFRDEIKVLMDRSRRPLAASGFIPSQATLVRGASFRLTPTEAIERALDDFAGAPVARGTLRATGEAHGYRHFVAGAAVVAAAKLTPEHPIRARQVYFHLGSSLVPGWYVELAGPGQAYSYVIAAGDGSLLFRNSQMATDAFAYRVWADGTAAHIPMDGPQGTAPTPHPTGLLGIDSAPYVAPALISLQNSPFSMNDPWLPSGATQSTGNNVDAYADLVSPDGFSAGDLRATTTSPGTFDRTYDPLQAPGASATQRMSAVTQLFFTNNFLHDWFYDAGFDEASGNAQNDNYGRGGFAGDRILAEAQDFSGTNNANMYTPSDGLSPRMQMYVFTPATAGVIVSASGITGPRLAGSATFGPQTFSFTDDVALATPNDGCSAISGVSGKIALIDRGTCTFIQKANNAQSAGATGVLIVNNLANQLPPPMGGSPPPNITIPVLSITKELGDSLKAALGSGTVTVTLDRPVEVYRDGTIDNQVVAHEWGHYISNRLVANGNGLTTNMSQGLGEGWGDFHSMLMTVRPEDVSAPANTNWTGVYSMGGYALGGVYGSSYYFGFRRVPYSTDLTKNALTFHHIEDGVPLPTTHPIYPAAPENSEVHNTGEIWCTMLWECYAALLNDTGRLTFDQAQLRMRDYLIAAYKLTPAAPTLTEARDALLAAAAANDPADYVLFWYAFAKRGAGMGAVSPDRNSATNTGVIESYVVGGDLAFVSAALTDDVASCDTDGYVDEGETGTLTITLRNTGAINLSSTTGSVSSTNAAVTFPSGTSLSFSSSTPFGLATATIPVKLQGSPSSLQVLDFQLSFGDPAQVTTNPQFATENMYGRANEVPSTTETAEELVLGCSFGGDPALDAGPWQRLELTSTSHVLFGPDPGAKSDQSVETPDLDVAGTGSFTFSFTHKFSFERAGGIRYDGGVIELSNNGGASWVDVNTVAPDPYNGTITTTSGNPLGGRRAFTGTNAGYPATSLVTINLGTTFAGQTVRVRFRIGADEAVGAPGWQIDDLAFTNLTNTPFMAVAADPQVCVPTAVEDDLPREVAFAIESAVPARGDVRMRFALPVATHAEIAVFDVAGRRMALLADGDFEAGRHAAVWRRDAAVGSGVYFARMTVGGRSITRRIVTLR